MIDAQLNQVRSKHKLIIFHKYPFLWTSLYISCGNHRNADHICSPCAILHGFYSHECVDIAFLVIKPPHICSFLVGVVYSCKGMIFRKYCRHLPEVIQLELTSNVFPNPVLLFLSPFWANEGHSGKNWNTWYASLRSVWNISSLIY